MPPSFVAQFRTPNTPSKLAPKNGESPSADGRISTPPTPSSNDRLNPPLSHQMNPERKKNSPSTRPTAQISTLKRIPHATQLRPANASGRK